MNKSNTTFKSVHLAETEIKEKESNKELACSIIENARIEPDLKLLKT